MIELIVLDSEWNELGSITCFNSLRWTRKYRNVGDFELKISVEDFIGIATAKYLMRTGGEETGIVETINNTQSEKIVTIHGQFLEKILADRVIDERINLNGTHESVIRQLVDRFAVNPTVTGRKINLLELGELNNTGETTVNHQVTGANLLEKCYEIAGSIGASIRVKYLYIENKITFEVFKGLDRTDSQDINSFAIFSNNEGNVLSSIYNFDSKDHKNFAFVAGEGEGSERIRIEVDLTDGDPRRELYVDARDLQRGDNLTAEEYEEVLRQRGLEKLRDCRIIESIYAEIDGSSNLIYGVDYDLGDLVTYQNDEIGVVVNDRITEITEIFEKNYIDLSVVLGDENKTEIQRIRKGLI